MSNRAPFPPRDYDAMARWVYDTCRLFGASPETSSEAAAIFVRGMRSAREQQEESTDVG